MRNFDNDWHERRWWSLDSLGDNSLLTWIRQDQCILYEIHGLLDPLWEDHLLPNFRRLSSSRIGCINLWTRVQHPKKTGGNKTQIIATRDTYVHLNVIHFLVVPIFTARFEQVSVSSVFWMWISLENHWIIYNSESLMISHHSPSPKNVMPSSSPCHERLTRPWLDKLPSDNQTWLAGKSPNWMEVSTEVSN